MIGTLIVLAKRPVPGRVKTRLMGSLTAGQAAQVAGAALRDTLDVAGRTAAEHRLLAFDGDPAGWVPAGWSTVAQPPGGLDERICAAFAAGGSGPSMLIGMDTPQLRPPQLEAFDPTRFDSCLGQTEDGGYWTIGLRDPGWADAAIRGVAMSSPETAAQQLDRLHGLGLSVQLLDTLIDVDTMADAMAVAAADPNTRMASVLAGLSGATPAARP